MGFLRFIWPSVKADPIKDEKKTNPQAEARKAMIRAKLKEDLENYDVCLADYESQGTLDFLIEDNTWSISFYREYIKEYAKEVRSRGGTVKVYKVKLQEYLTWLKSVGLENSKESRKEYITHLNNKHSR